MYIPHSAGMQPQGDSRKLYVRTTCRLVFRGMTMAEKQVFLTRLDKTYHCGSIFILLVAITQVSINNDKIRGTIRYVNRLAERNRSTITYKEKEEETYYESTLTLNIEKSGYAIIVKFFLHDERHRVRQGDERVKTSFGGNWHRRSRHLELRRNARHAVTDCLAIVTIREIGVARAIRGPMPRMVRAGKAIVRNAASEP